jgi:outer membrane protein W
VSFPKGRWEPYIGAGVSGNIRVFSGELEQEEGKRLQYTFGIGTIAGVTRVFTPRWGLSLEVGYTYFVNGLAQHSITDALSGAFFF